MGFHVSLGECNFGKVSCELNMYLELRSVA